MSVVSNPLLGEAGRKLHRDEARSDHGGPFGARHGLLQVLGIRERTQIKDSGSSAPGPRFDAGAATRRDEKLPVFEITSAVGAHASMLGLDVEGPRIKQDLYVLIPKVAIFEDRKALPRLLAQQEALGERRAMIREERFRGDDGHGAISPLLSQSLGGGCAGEPAADEQEISTSIVISPS